MIGGVGAEVAGRKMMLAACSLSREQRGVLECFLHDRICSLITVPTGEKVLEGDQGPSQGVQLVDCHWDLDSVMAESKNEGNRNGGGGERLENYRRWRWSQEGP